ncbi:hypothetical protein J3R30DRAFT_748344 [Lentinula aciculospora]|uniref:Uncharacterized protein n=1 Tax=Lentinula aciculospora TaxID=153920 RepID=A0A9W9DJ32_9AGAR|nr:hypothetical protein J3R30DRAFT_748344 [Lentinula aciculospora]
MISFFLTRAIKLLYSCVCLLSFLLPSLPRYCISMPDLPQELIDRLIDEVSESTEVLKNISLVGKSWLHRARYHLFRCMTLAPQDPNEIREYYEHLKRQTSSMSHGGGGRNYYQALSLPERQFLDSPLARNSQPTKLLLSSISDIIRYVRVLRLESSIRIGGGRRISPVEYFHRWLGYGGDRAEDCLLMRDLSFDEDFGIKQEDRWNAVDIPWGHRAGLYAIPFKHLRYIYIQWSVFGWIASSPVPEEVDDLEDDISANPNLWPGYQLGMLLKSSGKTLEQIFIDEYPGFQLEQYTSTDSADGLLNILARNAPNLRSFCLGGPILPIRNALRADEYLDTPKFVTRDRPVYRTGEEVPPVCPDPTCDLNDEEALPPHAGLSLERFFLQGFDSETVLLIEDALLNNGGLSVQKIKHLALSAMPEDFSYTLLFSRLRRSLTHLTLDVDQSTSNIELRFSSFPNLEFLQLIISSDDPTDLGHIICSLHNSAFTSSFSRFSNPAPLPGLLPIISSSLVSPRQFRLHITFGPGAQANIASNYLQSSSIDGYVLNEEPDHQAQCHSFIYQDWDPDTEP